MLLSSGAAGATPTAVPGARLLTTIWVAYPDDWGVLVATPAYQIWRE